MSSNHSEKSESNSVAEPVDARALGELIKRERIKRGLSLRKAGEIIGISHSYLASLENAEDPRTGMPLVPSREVITKIFIAYDMEVNEIAMFTNFGGEEDLLIYMSRKIHELKAKDPSKYRRMLNIIMGNSEE